MKSLALVALLVAGCARHEPSSVRSLAWAEPVVVKGAGNCFRVSARLYRSEQPTTLGMRNLERLGTKTVVNLRAYHSDQEFLKKRELRHEQIPTYSWAPDEDDLVRFLGIVPDPAKSPVVVHCWHGSDRTGAMCAAYRVVVQGWSKEEAIREMKEGGYGHHRVWGNLVRCVEDLDVEEIRSGLR